MVLYLPTVAADQQQQLSRYWHERLLLLESEQKSSVGGSLVLDKRERFLNSKLLALKRSEYEREPFVAAQHFGVARDHIKHSPIFRIIRDMPKGAILHLHDLSALSVEKTVQNITYMDHLYLCNKTKPIRLEFFSVPDSSCQWRLVSEMRAELGARLVDRWLEQQLSLYSSQKPDVYPSLHSVWSQFGSVMQLMLGMLVYDRAWKRYIQLAVDELVDDNISYLEIRTVLPQLRNLRGELFPVNYTIQMYRDVFQSYQNMGRLPFGGKIIFAPTRKISYVQLSQHIDLAIDLHRQFPHLMAGFDLVGQEDLGKPLVDFVPELMRLTVEGIPTYYHAGETYWQGTKVDENLYDAILLNASRIGHGFALIKHPTTLNEVIQRDIPIEICPISNQVLGLVSDLRDHPAAVLFATGAPLVVSSDDPGSWGASGLSYDLYVTFMTLTSRRMGLPVLKQLALNSIKYSALSKPEKNKFLSLWTAEWNKFVRRNT